MVFILTIPIPCSTCHLLINLEPQFFKYESHTYLICLVISFTHLPQNYCLGHPGGIKQNGYTFDSCKTECENNIECSAFDVTNSNWSNDFWCVIIIGEYTNTCKQGEHPNWDHYRKEIGYSYNPMMI